MVEIGPGPGALTRALLLEGAERVIAVERDRRCLPALEEIAARWPEQLTVIEGDALSAEVSAAIAAARGGATAKIVANLPYNIGTELVVRWLRDGNGAAGRGAWPSWWERAVLMLQREVADRIAAAPGSKTYGRLSVLTAWRADSEILFDVSPRAFTPAPKVTSSILRLTPRAQAGDCALEALERVTAAAFSQRRKMLRGALKSLTARDGAALDLEALLHQAGVAPDARAETLSLSDFVALAQRL